ncbi:DUF6875 domain-containing protein [Krasilnikovia sp. MM14-A1259]|uniref:DUF6875 domain-containing protein n=1 Tax=Krasilnikovia sp. MM14-A1259 TaxID=3373539 RepID=UPI0038305A59
MTAEVSTTVPARDDEMVARAVEWCTTFLTGPHDLIGRNGPVCPFVEPAIRGGTLIVQSRPIGADTSAEALDAVVEEMQGVFRDQQWAHSNEVLHALVMVLPRLPAERWHLLDELHSRVKPLLADRSLMLAQFHPDCLETAARNSAFPVAQAPVPMLALRNMAFHDILFLDSDRRMFHAYSRRYGARYATSTGIDPHFRQRFDRAARRFGVVASDPPPESAIARRKSNHE